MVRRDRANSEGERADKDWAEATLELAVELAGARADLRSDQAFGDWLEKRFGARAACQDQSRHSDQMGQCPEEARAILEKAEPLSVQVVDSPVSY